MVKYSPIRYYSTGLSNFALVCIFILLSMFYYSPCKAQVTFNTFRYPAEFEQQQAVWFGWEKNDSSYQNTAAKIIRQLQGKIPLKMAIDSYELGESAIKFLDKKGIDLDQIEFNVIPGDRFWIRDNGAVFLVSDNVRLGVVDFQWSSYGYYDWLINKLPQMADGIKALKDVQLISNESMLDQKIAYVTGSELIKSRLVIEGGALETNGKGVLLQCEQVTLQRNPGWTKKQIEEEYSRVLNIKKVIWLKNGTADDERKFLPYENYVFTGTGGHLDEFVRFADANTVLLAWIDKEDIDKHPLNRITYDRMSENLKILQAATDQDGNRFKIVKIPLPSIIEMDQDDHNEVKSDVTYFAQFLPEDKKLTGKKKVKIATVSYLNFLLTNGMVINASYVNHGTSKLYEDRVRAIFKEVFPDREQVWIDVFPINRNGGGIHCMTLNEPRQSKNPMTLVP